MVSFVGSYRDHLTGIIFTKADTHGNSFLSKTPVNTGGTSGKHPWNLPLCKSTKGQS